MDFAANLVSQEIGGTGEEVSTVPRPDFMHSHAKRILDDPVSLLI